jgi:hypothetical protein
MDMPTRTRTIAVGILILLGGVLFCYCALFYPIQAAPQVKGGSTTTAGSELTPAEKTPTDGVEQDKPRQTKQTPSERKPSRPRSGAT